MEDKYFQKYKQDYINEPMITSWHVEELISKVKNNLPKFDDNLSPEEKKQKKKIDLCNLISTYSLDKVNLDNFIRIFKETEIMEEFQQLDYEIRIIVNSDEFEYLTNEIYDPYWGSLVEADGPRPMIVPIANNAINYDFVFNFAKKLISDTRGIIGDKKKSMMDRSVWIFSLFYKNFYNQQNDGKSLKDESPNTNVDENLEKFKETIPLLVVLTERTFYCKYHI